MATPKDDLIINQPSNDDTVAAFPKFENEHGTEQVHIDENGWIVGLDEQAQPAPGAAGTTPAETPAA